MNTTRHEIRDLFGLVHRPGCPANRVVTRPAIIRPGYVYSRCATCGSIATIPAHEVVDNNGEQAS